MAGSIITGGRCRRFRPRSISCRIEKSDGTRGVRVWVDDLAGLLGFVEMEVIEVHPWGATVDDIEHPDLLAFNLKPGDGLDWGFVVETAERLRELLAGRGSGLLAQDDGRRFPACHGADRTDLTWEAAREFAKKIAERLQATSPDRYTLSARTNRTGKILIDYLRNGRGSTVVGAYSPRALPGFPIAAPISWRDLERGIRSDSFTMAKLPSSGRRRGK